ncbi:uncharacterized protein METZ01_LOCUS312113, partial [marine metagenome]
MTDPLRTNDERKEYAQLRLGPVGDLGDVLADFEGGCISVFGGIEGELVNARIYRYRRRRQEMTSSIVVEVIEPSPFRV